MARNETLDALYTAIEKTTADLIESKAVNVLQQAVALRELSLAYRYLAGGSQPGSVVVEK